MSGVRPIDVHCIFPHHYQVTVLGSYTLVNLTEQLHQFPARLEEGDRTGVYIRVVPEASAVWVGFFALGFDSPQVANGVYACPDPEFLCAVAGGYAYLVSAANPRIWTQIEQRPVVQVRPVPKLKMLLFAGFTSITALGESGQVWTTERLSWEGISITGIQDTTLHGTGWDLMADQEVPFEVDLLTGKSKGGARPFHSGT